MEDNILIIGAGICGLVIARELANAGKNVTVLEARDRPGGRIHTINNVFSFPVDAGAEFIHGDLPYTKSLLKEAGINTCTRKGITYTIKNGSIAAGEDFTQGLESVMKKLKELKKDVPFAQFLIESGVDEKVKAAAIRMAEGFDAADTNRVSSFSLREEWAAQNEDDTFQVKAGHSLLVEYLTDYCFQKGVDIHLTVQAKEVAWSKGHVEVRCSDGTLFKAPKVIITVPLGILMIEEGEPGHIKFNPAIPEKIQAAKMIGYGPVIKVIFEFKSAFWLDKQFKDKAGTFPDLDFLIGESYFSAWWTNPQQDAPILTGWVGGPKAEALKGQDDKTILDQAIISLAESLLTTTHFLEEQLVQRFVFNWAADPYSKGAYSYNTVESEVAKQLLSKPLEGTVYFAGEAINEGDSIGTVEAAIESGKRTVKKIL